MMHDYYGDPALRKQIATAYKANPLPSVQLQGFLKQPQYTKLLGAIKKASWKKVWAPDSYCYNEAQLPNDWKKYFSAKEFKGLVKAITGKELKGKPVLRSYSWQDYTLRNDEEKPPGLLVYIDCSGTWDSRWGGATIISNAYGELARVAPMQNTLVLIDCSKSWPFVQYCNHYAQKNKIVRIEFV